MSWAASRTTTRVEDRAIYSETNSSSLSEDTNFKVGPSIEDWELGTFPVTNRGIQIWLFLRPCVDSVSVLQAWLPCHSGPVGVPVAINLALWESTQVKRVGVVVVLLGAMSR